MENKRQKGYVLVWRSIREKGWYRNSHAVHLWIHLITEAAFAEHETRFGGNTIKLKPGQFVTGRKKIALQTGISESTTERWLKIFKKDGQIEQRTDRQSRLITINNWNRWQSGDTTSGQRVTQRADNERTLHKELNNGKNVNNNYSGKSNKIKGSLVKWLSGMQDVTSPEMLAKKYYEMFPEKIIQRAIKNPYCTSRSKFIQLCTMYKKKETL